MKPTQIYEFDIAANATFILKVAGEYFKIMGATAPVDVRAEWGKLAGLISGQGLENTPFSYLELTNTSGSANTVRVLVGDRNFVDGMAGSISVSANTVARVSGLASSSKTVTSASAQLLAANAGRSYLLIQNNHASGAIFINFGAAATLAGCIKIIPGGAFELGAGLSCTDAVHAIGDIASNASVVAVEG